jgi:hypothetical protein
MKLFKMAFVLITVLGIQTAAFATPPPTGCCQLQEWLGSCNLGNPADNCELNNPKIAGGSSCEDGLTETECSNLLNANGDCTVNGNACFQTWPSWVKGGTCAAGCN